CRFFRPCRRVQAAIVTVSTARRRSSWASSANWWIAESISMGLTSIRRCGRCCATLASPRADGPKAGAAALAGPDFFVPTGTFLRAPPNCAKARALPRQGRQEQPSLVQPAEVPHDQTCIDRLDPRSSGGGPGPGFGADTCTGTKLQGRKVLRPCQGREE